ncbi:FUSC family protein [Mesobacillus harenae]|uniref:FUSC family protein n=1 Tax=Mesobacillus harenae TaxID=2213203 RepID=UPI001580BF5C|nr:aromatic acid exporter family protein [Mesobacillus harenae]
MKLGARIFKTGIAIILALFLAGMFDLPAPVFAGIAAIFAVQPTIYRSYLSIIEQIQGNIIGALTAVVFVLVLGNNFIIVGLAAIIVITVNIKLKLENTIALSLVTLLAIMESPGEDFIQFAAIRFSTVILGVLSAFLVNLVFLPPKYENKLYNKNAHLTEEILRWIRLSSRHASEHQLLKIDIEKLKDRIIKLDQLYLMYKEERSYFKRNDIVKARKLVIYRQMITSTKAGLETLKSLHRYDNELTQMPLEFQESIQHQLDCLINHHEQLLLRFIGKIRSEISYQEGEICLNRRELFDLFLDQQKKLADTDTPMLYHMMQLVSVIMAYGEQVEHLDTLINSFKSYHREENAVVIADTPEE